MEKMIEVFGKWAVEWQVGFAVLLPILAYMLARHAMTCLTVLFRGHPPAATVVPEPQECYRSCNLTGLCLKPGGCKTQDECDHTLRLHTLAIKEKGE